ncbi:MAG: PD40 domain-containing protein [Anaerolineae bacterium]|nr:PD40 domain-containing protein [Anaerolineae bacterium]
MKRLIFITSCLIILILTACTTPQPPDPGRIYFVRDQTIWALNVADGQESQLLDYFPNQGMGMSVSPDGQWLVYPVVSDLSQPYSPRGLWVLNTRTGREIEIIREVAFVHTAWLPDSRLLVIEYPDWQVFSDGTGSKGVAHHTIFDLDTGESVPAAWYVSSPDNGTVEYAPTFECAAVRMIDRAPQAPDTLQVYCTGERDPITIATPLSLGNIAWSADGQLLAFYDGEAKIAPDTWRLHIWHRETGLIEEIDTGTRWVIAPSWSPDSQWLAFENNANLCILHMEDKEVLCFEDYPTEVGRPMSWSPDSQHLVLSACATGICEQVDAECDCEHAVLVTVSVPSGEITLLTTDVDINFNPLWGK